MATDNEACRRTREDLSASWPLPPAPSADSSAHLDCCAACRAELDSLKALAARSETKPWAALLRRTPRPEWKESWNEVTRPGTSAWVPALGFAALALGFWVSREKPQEPAVIVAPTVPARAPESPRAPVIPAVVEAPKRRPKKTVIVTGPKPAEPAPAAVSPADAPAELLENLALIENLELLENLEDAEALAEDKP